VQRGVPVRRHRRIHKVTERAPAPRPRLRQRTDIPTLVLAGEYDPITPPRWGEEVAETLSRGYFFTYPGIGHGATVEDYCPLDMALAFLRDPDAGPDASCIREMAGPYWMTEVPDF
jgi:pimeloyl-ACP methyl ester carboxylesterase